MLTLQRFYMIVLNPIYAITSKINEKIRDAAIYLCAFLIMTSYIIWASNVVLDLSVTQRSKEIWGAAVLFVIILMSIQKKLHLIHWNKSVFYTWIICCALIILTSFLHPIGDGFLTMSIIMMFEFPCLYFVWHNRGNYAYLFKLIAMAFSHVLTIYFVILFFFFPLGVSDEFDGRYAGSTYNPNSLGILCVVAIICALYLIILKVKYKGLYLFLIGLAGMNLISSVSRAALLILILMVLAFTIYFFLFIFGKEVDKIKGSLIIVSLYLVLVLSIIIIPYSINQTAESHASENKTKSIPIERLEGTNNGLDSLSSGRITLWSRYLNDLNLLGNDGTQKPEGISISPHNTALEIAYRSGIIAGVIYLIIEIYAAFFMLSLFANKKSRGEWQMFSILSIIAFGVYSFLDVVVLPFDKVPVFLFYLAIMPMFKSNKQLIKQAARK